MGESGHELIDRRAAFIGALLGRNVPERISSELVRWSVQITLGAMAYYALREKMSADDADMCRKQYMYGAAEDIRFAVAYREIQQTLNSHGIDFMPLKGMALILQGVYPNGALRLHCDIDLLMRSEDDCRRAAECLIACGWKRPGNKDSYHHVPPLFKRKVMLELHHLLPGVRDVELNRKYWEEGTTRLAGTREYRMSDELSFAVLFSHTAINHDWEFGERFLLDAGLLMARPGFDLAKSFAYCREIGITRPENMISAFPEIFGGNGDRRHYAVMRRHVLGSSIPFASLVMSGPGRFSWSWWRKRLGGFSIRWLRQKYGAENANWWKMMKIIAYDYKQKIVTGWAFLCAPDAARTRRRNSDATREQLGVTVPNEELNHL